MSIVLKEDVKSLDEVVVVAYGHPDQTSCYWCYGNIGF